MHVSVLWVMNLKKNHPQMHALSQVLKKPWEIVIILLVRETIVHNIYDTDDLLFMMHDNISFNFSYSLKAILCPVTFSTYYM